MPINWSKWGSREEALRAFVDHLDNCAGEALSTGAKYQDPYERARLEVARKEVRASFDYLVEHLLDPIENIELRRLGYEGILQFATAAFEIGVYGTYTATNKNFFEEIVRRELASAGGKQSGIKRREKREWVKPVENSVKRMLAKNPTLSAPRLAEKIAVMRSNNERNYPPAFSARRSGARLLISAPPCQGVQSLNPCPHGTD
jgi:hypothetical protein